MWCHALGSSGQDFPVLVPEEVLRPWPQPLPRRLSGQTPSPLLSFLSAVLHEKVAASSLRGHCNYCFTIECLNHSLQILCIYGKGLSSHLL